LEIYVEGDLLTHGWSVRYGDQAAWPDAVDVYVGGETIDVSGVQFTGSLTAPNAVIVDTSNIAVSGKILVGSVDGEVSLHVDYDSGLPDDTSCTPGEEEDPDRLVTPPGGGGGQVTGCQSDADCENAQTCNAGMCVDVPN